MAIETLNTGTVLVNVGDGGSGSVAVGLGVYPNMDAVDELIGISREVRPDAARWKRYDGMYREYRSLYDALVPIHRRLYQIP